MREAVARSPVPRTMVATSTDMWLGGVRLAQATVDRRASRLGSNGRLLVMMASALMSARASPANTPRTLWMTERMATMAPTPMDRQMKKNRSRRHDARISRIAIAATKFITGRRPASAVAARSTGRPSRSVSRASAIAATLGSWVTSTSVDAARAAEVSSSSRM